MTKFLIYLLFALLPTFVYSDNLPTNLAVPGGIVNIPLYKASSPAPQVFFQKKRVLIVKKDNTWTAVIGIPLKTKAGDYSINVKSGVNRSQFNFKVYDKQYPAQYITLKNKRMVNPIATDLKRIRSERPIINKALNTWTAQAVSHLNFKIPVKGRLSSPFGLKRFFNNQAKNPHSGLDIAAPTGTAIHAPSSATVINTGSYYYNGNSVFLDHGQGLISGYFHLSKINVTAGQRVTTNTKLGEIGSTGRVTGPHLHWNVYLNKTKVDPALFVDELSPSQAEPPKH